MPAEYDELRELLPPTPVPPELCARAVALARSYSWCFWFEQSRGCIQQLDDVRSLVRHLRENGDHRAWLDAQELHGHLLQFCAGQPIR